MKGMPERQFSGERRGDEEEKQGASERNWEDAA
jgi:hypothetical protein